MNVVGLGNAGCNIAKYFENYPQYNVSYVDVGLGKSGKSYGLTKRDTHEAYDKKQIRMAKFVDQMPDTGECLFIIYKNMLVQVYSAHFVSLATLLLKKF